ncbi:LysR family transcriptional regulator [Streptomyces sp. NPDC090088]|uniref:LysR family transcriptional regulator n=1 Tax=Streptomyces sp. NPDC090088 TaxID=3365944 RepID=UPI00382A18D4
MANLDLNLLVALQALLEESNVTRAAARLGTGQPAMSASLQRLRRHYRDELLVRIGREYRLTPFARTILPGLRTTVRNLELALSPSPDFTPEDSSRVFRIALSDYAVTVLQRPLLRQVRALAPGVRIEFGPLPPRATAEQALLETDVLVGPRGFGFPGASVELFRDRLVCVADPANPALVGRSPTLADLSQLRHAVAVVGGPQQGTPSDRLLDQLGVRRSAQVTVSGWLPTLFALHGTQMIAVVPERLALRVAASARVTVHEPPFPRAELIEAAWWHPEHEVDSGHRWLTRVLREVGEGLAEQQPGWSRDQ